MFKRMCRFNNYKVPLTLEMLEYYKNLGYECIVLGVDNFFGSVKLSLNNETYELLTIRDIRLLLLAEDIETFDSACESIIRLHGLRPALTWSTKL